MAGFNIPSLQVPSRGLAPTISECSQSPSRPLENMTELFLRQKLITVVSIKKKKKKKPAVTKTNLSSSTRDPQDKHPANLLNPKRTWLSSFAIARKTQLFEMLYGD